MRHFTIFILSLSLFGNIGQGQSPTVLNTSPSNQTIQANAASTITVNFSQALDTSSVNTSSFRVFGRWSGPATGSFSFFDENKQVIFLPDEPFFAGEWVSAALTKAVKSETGEHLAKPFAWNFWIETAPGQLDQSLVEIINLHLPGDPTYLQTYGAYAGDMNNDGYSDLVAVNESSDDLRILLNDGQGMYPSFTVYDTGDDSTPSPSEGADFNNDGEIDMVVTTAWDSEVRVLTGDGQGGFSNMKTYFTSNGVRGVVAGDFNGDGWDDMLTTNRLAGNISIFINDGTGNFAISNMDLPGEDETACSLADINNDGLLDIFYASFNSQKVGVLLGDGTGNFNLTNAFPVQGKPWMIAAGDFNGDGNADVASVNSNGNNTTVLFGDGQGGLNQATVYSPSDHNFPLAIDVGDLDGDGDLEMVTSNYSSGTFTIFENDGAGNFIAPVTLQASNLSSCAILHDRDNDGDLDITATDEGDDAILLFENPGQASNISVQEQFTPRIYLFPNPINSKFSAAYSLKYPQEVTSSLYSPLGIEVKKWKKNLGAGNHLEHYDVPTSPKSGCYIFRIKCSEFDFVKKVFIVK